MLVDPVVAAYAWLSRLAEQIHARFLWGSAALAMVTAFAGRDKVVPAVRATTVARDHVVDGEIFPLFPAVLTGVVVAHEDFLAR